MKKHIASVTMNEVIKYKLNMGSFITNIAIEDITIYQNAVMEYNQQKTNQILNISPIAYDLNGCYLEHYSSLHQINKSWEPLDDFWIILARQKKQAGNNK